MQLAQAVEQRKEYLINKLIDFGVYEAAEGKQLYELPCAELEKMYITERCKIGREISKIIAEE